MASSSAVPMTPGQGARCVHFSPEPAGESLHQGLRHRHGHQIQSDIDNPFTGPEGNVGMFSRTQVRFYLISIYL